MGGQRRMAHPSTPRTRERPNCGVRVGDCSCPSGAVPRLTMISIDATGTAPTSTLLPNINSGAVIFCYVVAGVAILVGGIWFYVSSGDGYIVQMSLVLRGIATYQSKQAPNIHIIFMNVGHAVV